MAGIREEIELDVASGLRSIDALDARLTQAAQGFKRDLAQALDVLRGGVTVEVEADARGVTRSVDAALEAADSGVIVTADAADVTGSIDAAVEDADTGVVVEGDATGVTRAVDAALENADTNVDLTVDDASARRAASAVREVKDEAAAADRAAAGLGGALGGVKKAAIAVTAAFGIREVVDQLHQAVNAASDLAESTSKAEQVFRDGAGTIKRWGETSATSVGLAKQQAIEAAATFGNLFTALGTTREEATRLSPEVVQLGADLASFNNLGVDETLEKLRSGLVGEVEPLRSLGVSFNAAQVEAKGMALGLADASGALSEGAKVQARYALILDQTKTAQGDFARTSDGLANQQRILAAEVGNARAELGEALLPIVLELVTQFRAALPAIKETAIAAGPLLASSVRTFLPVGLSLLDLLTSLTPVLELAADVLNALPKPVVQAGAAFGLLGSGLGPLPNLFKDVVAGFKGSEGAAGGLAGGLAAVNPWVLAGTVAITGLTFILGQHRKEQQENEAAIKAATAAFRDQSTAIEEDVAALVKNRVEAKNQVDDLRRLGLSFEQFTAFVRDGAAGYEDFAALLVSRGEISFNRSKAGVNNLADAVRLYGSVQKAVNAGAINGNTGLLESYTKLGNQAQDAARDQLDYLVTSEAVTESDIKQATARNHLADGTVDYVGVLEDVSPAQEEAGKATDATTGAVEDQADALKAEEKALNDVITALDKYLDRQVDGLNATIDFEQSIDDVTASIKENGRTLDLNTEKGRNNQRALLDVRDSLIKVAEERFEESGSAQEAANSVALHTLRLAANLRQAGLTEAQIRTYIDALHLTPEEVRTEIVANTKPAEEAVRRLPGSIFRAADEAGAAFDDGIAAGMDRNLAKVNTAAHGVAAAAIATAKLAFGIASPSKVGMSIGGFFVQGLTLGIEGERVMAENAAKGMSAGVAAAVREAARITNEEALGILNNVAQMKDAEEALAKVRKDKKATALDRARAELTLKEAVRAVNESTLAAIDSSDARADALKRESDAAQALADDLDNALSAFDALGGVAGSRRSLTKAQEELAEAQARQAALPGEIQAATEALARAQAQAGTVTTSEAAAIVRARQAVARADKDVADVMADGTATQDDRTIATLEAQLAREALTQAEADSVSPTRDVEEAERALKDLRTEQAAVQERVRAATETVTQAQFALIASEERLIEVGKELIGQGDGWQETFRKIALAAGLSRAEIDLLVASIQAAVRAADDARSGRTSTGGGGTGAPAGSQPVSGNTLLRGPDGVTVRTAAEWDRFFGGGGADPFGFFNAPVGSIVGVAPVAALAPSSPALSTGGGTSSSRSLSVTVNAREASIDERSLAERIGILEWSNR